MDQMLVILLYRGNEVDLKQIITKASVELTNVFVNKENNQLVVITFQSSEIFSENEIRGLEKSIDDPVEFTRKICALLKQRYDVLSALNILLNVDLNNGNLQDYQLKIRRIFIRLLQDKLIKNGNQYTYNQVEFEQLLRVKQIKVELEVENVPSSKNETNLSELPERLEDMVRYGKQIKFQFEMPTENQSADRKNYALVINIITFPGHNPRDGAEKDTENMVKLLESLNFTIFPESKRTLYGGEWNKQDVIKQLESFKKKCIDDKVDSVVVFFGSHGCNDILQTSDLDSLDVYGDIIYELQVDVKDAGKKVPQIFINQSCQTDPPSNFKHTAIKPTVSDSLYVKAQIPKCKATRDAECGAYFVNALVYVLMKKACNTSLQNMLKEVQIRLKQMGKLADSLDSSKPKEEEDQMSTSTDLGLKNDFYFFKNY